MRNRGLSLVETLVVLLITISFLVVIFGVFLVGRNSWATSAAYIDLQEKTRLAMDKMAKELSTSNPITVTIGDCNNLPPNFGYECYGNYIEFQVPVVTDGTIFNNSGKIKFGAEDHEGWTIKYLVQQGGANDHRLIRIAPENMPTGACCRIIAGVAFCVISTEQACIDGGGSYKGDHTTCNPIDPCNGACCQGTNCSVITSEACNEAGGSYQGDGTDCATTPCASEAPCFLGDTPILMPDGSEKPIEDISPGESIMAFDEKLGRLVVDKVAKVSKHKINEYLVINNHLRLTPNHPVYSNGIWVEIGKLKVGDMLTNSKGESEPITSIQKITESVKVYNLEVNPYHTYIAGGYVVHNKELEGVIGEDGLPIRMLPLGACLRNFLSLPLAYADEISVLASDIKELSIMNPNTGELPNSVDITIVAERKSMLGESIEVNLTSRVYLRN
jgi:hypothetical protein